MSRQDAVAAREVKLEEIASRLEAAVEELTTGEDWCRALTFAARFRSRRAGNVLLIHAQHAQAYGEGRVPDPFPSFVAGFKQWRALGRHVDKGQGGYQIFAPLTPPLTRGTRARGDAWTAAKSPSRARWCTPRS